MEKSTKVLTVPSLIFRNGSPHWQAVLEANVRLVWLFSAPALSSHPASFLSAGPLTASAVLRNCSRYTDVAAVKFARNAIGTLLQIANHEGTLRLLNCSVPP